MSERDKIVAYIRREGNRMYADDLANAIEAGEHLKRPDPPADEFVTIPRMEE